MPDASSAVGAVVVVGHGPTKKKDDRHGRTVGRTVFESTAPVRRAVDRTCAVGADTCPRVSSGGPKISQELDHGVQANQVDDTSDDPSNSVRKFYSSLRRICA